MDLKIKLDKLKKKHSSLNEQYGEIYTNGQSYEEEELLDQMRPIEATFRTLDLNVFTYKRINEN